MRERDDSDNAMTEESKGPSVLFVCTANMCRSPTAEVILESMLRERGLQDDWWVDSAGTHAPILQSATALAQRVMEERGLDLSGHRSKRVDRRVMLSFNLILVMEPMHLDMLMANYPDLSERIHLLTAVAGESGAVHDPVGGSLEQYRAIADRLIHLLKRGFDEIQSLATD